MKDQLFEYIVTTDSYNRNWIVAESLLYRIVLKFINKESYLDLVEKCQEVLNMLYCDMTTKEWIKYFQQTREHSTYTKRCLCNDWAVLDFIEYVKEKEGRL